MQGYADAAYALALCYRDGTGVSRDVQEAMRLLEDSIEQGNCDAVDLLKSLKANI